MKRSDNKGFTILELMAIVAIVSILAVLALNAYSDYATRAQVSEGLGFAAEAKSSVLTAYSTGAGIPTLIPIIPHSASILNLRAQYPFCV